MTNETYHDSIEELAGQLVEEGRANELESCLQEIKCETLNPVELESWHHYYGICAFQRDEHEEACRRFASALQVIPESQSIRFSLGQEYMLLNQPKKGFLEFDQCSFPAIDSNFVMVMDNYAYLFNQHTRGAHYINQFLPSYLDIKTLDDHVLYTRNIPFFSSYWLRLAGHCILGKCPDMIRDILVEIKKNCIDYDFERLALELKAYQAEDYSEVISLYKTRIEEHKKLNAPTDYLSVQIACLSSLMTNNYAKSIRILDSATPAAQNDSLLANILLLAKACISHRFNQLEEEDQYKCLFIERNPLLLQLEHVLSFGMLYYQERLKTLILPFR